MAVFVIIADSELHAPSETLPDAGQAQLMRSCQHIHTNNSDMVMNTTQHDRDAEPTASVGRDLVVGGVSLALSTRPLQFLRSACGGRSHDHSDMRPPVSATLRVF